MTSNRKPGKGAPSGASDISNIPDPSCDESPEGRRNSVKRFVEYVRDRDAPPHWLLERVAALLSDRLDVIAPKSAKRPRKSRKDKFLAWFAVERDPDFQKLPRTRDGLFHAVGELLNCDATKVQRYAASFAKSRKGTDCLLPIYYGERYAEKKRIPWNLETAETFMRWYDSRPMRKKPG